MEKLRQRMIEDMKLRGLAASTQTRYLEGVKSLAKHYNRPPDQLTQEEVRKYLLYLIGPKGYSKNTFRINLFALKFLYRRTLQRDWRFLESTRVKSDKRLPVVLSREEVWSLLDMVRRPKARMSLTLMYTCGLRVAEAVNLRLEDIDSKRMVLWVRNGKGHKDRSVALPTQTLAQLRAYWSGHRPTTWFFPSREGTSAIKTSGVQHCLKKTLQQSPIRKKVTCHTLRHSYATHLLEAGVHLRAIQSLMGHKNITTTFIYMHLTQGTMVDVQTKINKLMRRD
jgi:site-specific recombinase XerD